MILRILAFSVGFFCTWRLYTFEGAFQQELLYYILPVQLAKYEKYVSWGEKLKQKL